jgi:hypothetical protein
VNAVVRLEQHPQALTRSHFVIDDDDVRKFSSNGHRVECALQQQKNKRVTDLHGGRDAEKFFALTQEGTCE